MHGPVLTPLEGTDRRWRVVETWRGYGVTIPVGFTTDLASFPRFVEPIMHRNSWCWVIAGVVHDWYTATRYRSRRFADDELRRIAIAEGAPRWQANVVWVAVRLFGAPSWNRPRGM